MAMRPTYMDKTHMYPMSFDGVDGDSTEMPMCICASSCNPVSTCLLNLEGSTWRAHFAVSAARRSFLPKWAFTFRTSGMWTNDRSWYFLKVQVCLDCGCSSFMTPVPELKRLRTAKEPLA